VEVIRLIPGFIVDRAPTEEDAPRPTRRFRGEDAVRSPGDPAYVAQQNEMLPPADRRTLGIASFQCPGCATVRCGFLGHDTCLVCC
jgi:hypothetical protein